MHTLRLTLLLLLLMLCLGCNRQPVPKSVPEDYSMTAAKVIANPQFRAAYESPDSGIKYYVAPVDGIFSPIGSGNVGVLVNQFVRLCYVGIRDDKVVDLAKVPQEDLAYVMQTMMQVATEEAQAAQVTVEP